MKKASVGTKTIFFDDKPLFGMDIGYDMLRVMQINPDHKVPKLKGYGSIAYDPSAIGDDGVIVKPELIAKVAYKLFNKELIGDIDTRRVALSVPASRAYTHTVQLPKMNSKDIEDAIQTEASQFLPVDLDSVYMDHTLIRQDEKATEVFIAAVPRKVVDSYVTLTHMLGLEPVLFDTTIGANARLFSLDKMSNVPSVLVGFGAETTDITVLNRSIVVTGTVAFGGDNVTNTIAQALRISPKEALPVKSKYGLSASDVQKTVTKALEPSLALLIKELRRTIRYYEQRYTDEQPITQIVTMGGSANMPGLAEYLTDHLLLPVRPFDPSFHLDFGHLRPFYNADRMSYVTVAGLAMTNPAEIFV